MSEINYSTIMIELDALLDTRLACLAHLEDDKIKEILDKGYHTRTIDEFPGISYDQFKEIYDKRDKSILRNAIVTPMITLLNEFTIKTLKQTLSTPFHYKPKILINIHPYKLDEEDINNIILSIVKYTDGKCDVGVVSMTHSELTIGYVKRNLSILIMYDCYTWLEHHSKTSAWKKMTCPEVTLFAPAIYFKPKTPLPDNENPFIAMEKLVAIVIGLKLLPVESFSMVIKPTDKL